MSGNLNPVSGRLTDINKAGLSGRISGASLSTELPIQVEKTADQRPELQRTTSTLNPDVEEFIPAFQRVKSIQLPLVFFFMQIVGQKIHDNLFLFPCFSV
jgi:hypothetical protein